MSETHDAVTGPVQRAVESWVAWVPKWHPPTQRARSRVCRRCTGSPVLTAAGLEAGVPHQVAHALNMRMQRIVDRAVDAFTEAELPLLCAELRGAEMWQAAVFQPEPDLPPELDGLDLDPEPEDGQPYLFTLAELAAVSEPGALLPRPPLTEAEKQQLRQEISRADDFAERIGNEVCFALLEHREVIARMIGTFVDPQIEELLAALSRELEPPSEL